MGVTKTHKKIVGAIVFSLIAGQRCRFQVGIGSKIPKGLLEDMGAAFTSRLLIAVGVQLQKKSPAGGQDRGRQPSGRRKRQTTADRHGGGRSHIARGRGWGGGCWRGPLNIRIHRNGSTTPTGIQPSNSVRGGNGKLKIINSGNDH